MRYSDIEKFQEAGLITTEQQRQIVEDFELKEEGSKAVFVDGRPYIEAMKEVVQ